MAPRTLHTQSRNAVLLHYRPLLVAALLLALPLCAFSQTTWLLKESTLTYRVSHPLHHVDGVSHGARGQGVCQSGQCSFLIAVPVKSFASGDTNRDLHMLEVTRGAQFPLVVVHVQVPEAALGSPSVNADLEIDFAGQKALYDKVAFHLAAEKDQVRLTGTIPAMLSDFKIPPPELVFVPIKNQIPVDVDMTWEKQK